MSYRGPQYSRPALIVGLGAGESFLLVIVVLQENYGLTPGNYIAWFEEKEPGGEGFVDVTLKTPEVQFRIEKEAP
jgi:hypothetical protein